MDKIDKLSNLHVKVVGVNLENLLFELSLAGIVLKHVKKRKKALSFVVSGQNFEKVLLLTKKYDQKIKIMKQSGLASWLKSVPYSIGAFLGIVVSCFFVHVATSSIANIDIEIVDRQNKIVQDKVKCVEITDYLTQIGVAKGVVFAGKTKDKENKICAQFDFVESCRIERYGNYVKVFVKEASIPQVEVSSIVASADGVVTNIVTFAGKSKVKAGDIVKKGQELVSKDGNILPKAQIDIRAWRVGTAFHYEKTQKVVRTGKKQASKAIFAWDWKVFDHIKCKFDLFETETTFEKVSDILPIYVETQIFFETKVVDEIVPFEQAQDEVKEKAKKDAIKGVNEKIEKCTFSVVNQKGVTRVDCAIEYNVQILVK